MFIDTSERPAGEVQQKVGRLKLSEIVRECGYGERMDYQDCVLGRAYAKVTGGDLLRDGGGSEIERPWVSHAAKALGVPFAIADKAEDMCLRRASPSAIADWLQSQGL